MLSIFSYGYLSPVYPLRWISVHVFYPFSNWIVCFLLLSFKNSSHSLDTSPLSGMWLANVFTDSVPHLFIIFNKIFYRPKVFDFDKVQLNNFSLYGFAFGARSKNILLESLDVVHSVVSLHLNWTTMIVSPLLSAPAIENEFILCQTARLQLT